jgi:cytochrome c-type biogenesis protein CcmH
MPAVALGAAVALVATVAALGLRPSAEPAAAARADALARELRCPDCQGLSVADSPTAAAGEIRRQIQELIADGADDDAVRAHFVARYGEWILLAPKAPAAWVIPFAAVLLAAGGLAAWLLAGRRTTEPAGRGLTPEQRRRLREEVEALDA